MKTLATFFLLFAGLTAVAQRSSYRQHINDDGKKLVIRIDQQKNGKEFHYSNTFEVSGMNDEEKSALVRRVLDSVRFEEKASARTETFRKEGAGSTWEKAPELKAEVASAQQAIPFTKSVEEDTAAQRIKVSYRYVRNGEEHSFERTINKQGKTREEVEKLIEETEESIGLSAKNS